MGEAQFITKMQDRAVSAAATYGAAMTYALRLQGVNVEPGQLRVNMAPVAPMGEKESWELAEIQHRLGMPLRQILKERGYEPEQIAAIERQIRDEMDAADERRRMLFNGGVYDALAASAGGDEAGRTWSERPLGPGSNTRFAPCRPGRKIVRASGRHR